MALRAHVVAVLRSRWALLLSGLVLGVLGSIGYALFVGDSYVSTATLLIDGGAGDAAQIDLLRSERVARRVVENEHLLRESYFREELLDRGNSAAPADAIAARLADSVEAFAAGEGRLVQVRMRLGDAALSARIANAWAQAYGEVSLQLRAESIRSGVERARQDLADLRLRMDLARLQGGHPETLAAAGAHADEQFARLTRLALEAGKGGPALASTPDARDQGGGSGVDSERADLPLRLGSPAPAATLSPERNGQAAVEEVAVAQQSLDRTQERLARISAESIGAPFPVHVLLAAQVAGRSAKPSTGICLALGLLAGLVLAVIAFFLAELLDRRVRHASDVSRRVGVPVLGDLPAMAAPTGRPRPGGVSRPPLPGIAMQRQA
jgi:capsular polysaccharide biosynthesis protein